MIRNHEIRNARRPDRRRARVAGSVGSAGWRECGSQRSATRSQPRRHEEQGLRGAKAFDVAAFGADFGYTLDCCGIGEFVYENWNAGDAEIIFTGQSAHPMSAKGKLKNSLLMAHKFIAMLPGGEAPEYTEGREGYYWVKHVSSLCRFFG